MLYQKPADVYAFLDGELQRLAGGRTAPTFFTEDDFKGMFTLFDPTGRGVISRAQVETGMVPPPSCLGCLKLLGFCRPAKSRSH